MNKAVNVTLPSELVAVSINRDLLSVQSWSNYGAVGHVVIRGEPDIIGLRDALLQAHPVSLRGLIAEALGDLDVVSELPPSVAEHLGQALAAWNPVNGNSTD